MEQVDGTVEHHITQLARLMRGKAPPSSFCSGFLSIDRSKMFRFASSKEKAAHLRLVRVAPLIVWVARRSPEGTRVVFHFH